MKKVLTLLFVQAFLANELQAQFNPLPIPDTLVTTKDPVTGQTNYDLSIHEGFTQILPGNQTITHGYNQYSLFGPTLIMREGDSVQMSVFNETNEPTTVHWHGIHLPPVMDGGPHQIIGTGTTWKPYWKVCDSAATYWYHAHLDFETDALVAKGQAGLIIVKDKQEATLPLPRTYKVDDIPIILADRRFDTVGGSKASNQIVVKEQTNFQLTNGVINAQTSLPAQVVRLRILNASTFHVYNLGFSTDGIHRTEPFYVIASDGGLLNAPVKVDITDTTFFMAPGERYEVLLNLTGHTVGNTLTLMAFNSELPLGVPGSTIPDSPTAPMLPDPFDLGGHNFPLLSIVIGSPTPSPITSIPATLKTNKYPDTTGAKQQAIKFTYTKTAGGSLATPIFTIDDLPFQMGVNNITVPLGATEKWVIENTLVMVPPVYWPPGGVYSSHVFHIHDVQFHIISKTDTSGNPILIPLYQQGWKDDFLIDYNQKVKFVAKFEDFADNKWPYMYHCHMLSHEDQAMMAQFIVADTATPHPGPVVNSIGTIAETGASIYPNPTSDRLHIDLEDKTASIYYITISDVLGRKKLMLPKPMVSDGLDVSMLSPGEYVVKILDTRGNTGFRKFTKL